MDLTGLEVDRSLLEVVPEDFARKQLVFPISKEKNTLKIAIADITNLYAQDELKFMTSMNVRCVVASASEILAAIEKHYRRTPT